MPYNLPPLPPTLEENDLRQWLHEVVKKLATVIDDVTDASNALLLQGNNSAYHLARSNHTGTEADAAITQSSVLQHEAALNHTAILNIGTNTHAQIDTHIADATLHFVIATTAQLEDITHTINTDAAKVLGYPVLNTTTGILVFASGDTDGSVWHYYDSTTAHTPV